MTEQQIKEAWIFIEGKAEGLMEAGGAANFPVLFAQYILAVTKQENK